MKAFVALIILALPFGGAAILAAAAGLVLWPFYGYWPYVKNLYRAMDKLGAALLGFSGEFTLSAECGSTECWPCAVLCRFLNLFQKNHCKGAAQKEKGET